MDDYREIKEMLKPRRDIRASDNLREKVRLAAYQERRSGTGRKLLWGGLSLGVVAAVVALLLVPSGMSAKDILAEVVEALQNARNIEMIVEIRTSPIENFRYIDIDDDFVTHKISVAGNDSLFCWRVDKGERSAVGNGDGIYTWIPSLNLGLHLGDSDSRNVLGYLANLLSPARILETELAECTGKNDAEYKVIRKGDEIFLTINSGPQGNFDNPYLLNTSIVEAENIRRYVIDSATRRLKSASVSIVARGSETEVLKISSITYGSPQPDICRLPQGIRFIEWDDRPVGLRGLSAEEAASTVLSAFLDWNTGILDKVFIREMSDKAYREKFRGSKLVSVGRAFTSGAGNTIFVPYTLQLRDSSWQRHNLALQKTDSIGWIVVGGL